jgi:hypothetical protein
MNKVQNTFLTCSFFPNASITASTSACSPCWISFGKNTNSGGNRTAALMNAREISVYPANQIPAGTAMLPEPEVMPILQQH